MTCPHVLLEADQVQSQASKNRAGGHFFWREIATIPSAPRPERRPSHGYPTNCGPQRCAYALGHLGFPLATPAPGLTTEPRTRSRPDIARTCPAGVMQAFAPLFSLAL